MMSAICSCQRNRLKYEMFSEVKSFTPAIPLSFLQSLFYKLKLILILTVLIFHIFIRACTWWHTCV